MLNKLDHATDTDDPHVTLNQIRNLLPEEEHEGEVQYRTCSGMTGEGIGEGTSVGSGDETTTGNGVHGVGGKDGLSGGGDGG